jgi:hypothetical protein
MDHIKLLICFLFVLVFSWSVSGCIGQTGSVKPQSQQSQPQKPATQVPEKPKEPTAVYYDFEDVLVPTQLKVMKERTVVVSTPGFRSGILALMGRVDPRSLYNIFSINMVKDNWNEVSKIKSPDITIMVFEKTSRCAVITIRDSQFYTYVEIGVAPTVSTSSSDEMSQTDIPE